MDAGADDNRRRLSEGISDRSRGSVDGAFSCILDPSAPLIEFLATRLERFEAGSPAAWCDDAVALLELETSANDSDGGVTDSRNRSNASTSSLLAVFLSERAGVEDPLDDGVSCMPESGAVMMPYRDNELGGTDTACLGDCDTERLSPICADIG